MSYKPSDSYYGEFTTQNFNTGVATDASSLPVATATQNGTDDATFTLTVTNMDTGRYKITGTIPAGYSSGDSVQISVAATVGGVSGKAVIDSFVIDSQRNSDLNTSLDIITGTDGTTLATLQPNYAPATPQQVWEYATRTLTAFGFNVTVGTNSDKTGYSLTAVYDPSKEEIMGPGADRVTITIKVRNTAIADADVWICSDPNGASVVAGTLQTNSNGQVTFLLDNGSTYYLFMQKDGVKSIVGEQFVARRD